MLGEGNAAGVILEAPGLELCLTERACVLGHLPVDGRPDALSTRFGKDRVERERGGAFLSLGWRPQAPIPTGSPSRSASQSRNIGIVARKCSIVSASTNPAPDNLPNPSRGLGVGLAGDESDHAANVGRFGPCVNLAPRLDAVVRVVMGCAETAPHRKA